MSKYVITFSKMGTICYISHLDLMKMFKRTFKKADIRLVYSQGFNPHPKMGFAQPLSLGYEGLKELIEFETVEDFEPEVLKERVAAMMPVGIEILDCSRLEGIKKTLAANTVAADYDISIPLNTPLVITADDIRKKYLGQDAIITYKKQKKKKDLAEVNIKPMIRSIAFKVSDDALNISALLDSCSTSNLSPELVINTLIECLGIDTDRSEVAVTRKEIIFE